MNAEEKSIETLGKIKKIFDKHHIEYWLDEGTLLGAVREKKFIEWDHDIDLGAWAATIPKIIPLFDEIRKEGIETCFHEGKKHIKFLSEGYEIDINPYHLKNEKATRTWYKHNKLGQILDYLIWTMNLKNANIRVSDAPYFVTKIIVSISKILPVWKKRMLSHILFTIFGKTGCTFVPTEVPSYFFTDLSSLKFYNMMFKVPKKTEEYLEYKYGKDWKTPKRNYVYTTDDQSIVKD